MLAGMSGLEKDRQTICKAVSQTDAFFHFTRPRKQDSTFSPPGELPIIPRACTYSATKLNTRIVFLRSGLTRPHCCHHASDSPPSNFDLGWPLHPPIRQPAQHAYLRHSDPIGRTSSLQLLRCLRAIVPLRLCPTARSCLGARDPGRH